MRELFPTEAGGTGVNRVTGSMPGSQSRPHSTMRSPTIPPLSVPRSPPPTRPSLPRLGHVPTPPPRRSFLTRGSTWGALALVVLGVGVGALVSRSTANRDYQVAAPGIETTALPKKFSIRVSSIPEGASIYVYGENRFLGTTDTILPFEVKDVRPSLLFKKAGYHDEIREVNPYSILVTLRPLERGRDKAAAPGQPAAPSSPPSSQGSAPSGSPPSAPGSGPIIVPTTAPPPPAPGSAPPPARAQNRERNRKQLDPNQIANPF